LRGLKRIGKVADGYTERIIWHISKIEKTVGVSVLSGGDYFQRDKIDLEG